ncbi:unnamed protein product [Sphacelaria rigidula]
MPTLRNSERVDEATHGGCENGAIKSTMASKEEEDVPDDEWRRPLMISPPNRSRASAGRRRPNIRRPPQDELVVLALDDPGSNVEYGMEGQRRAGQGRKRPRIDGKDSGGGRSQETPPPMPTRVNRQSNTSWAALRRTLHERYRECLENGAAQASAAEASRRARFGDSANARGGYGKLLSPGLRVFWRQEQAFAYVDEVGARLPHHEAARYKVLSFETSSTGSRKFLVCDFWRFEEQYLWVARPDSDILRQVSEKPRASQHDQQSRDCGTPISDPNTHATTPQISGALENDERAGCVKPLVSRAAAPWPLQHVYEIIREGMPCRMYFDLEFTRACNVGLDGEALVRAWINVVAGKLQQDFGISVGKTDFLDLDSSTAKKFSRHLIVHLPGDQLFADNSHVGRFVNTLAADLEIFKPPPAAAGSCPPLSAMSGPIPTPSPGDIPRLAPQAQQNWTHRSSLEHTSLQAAAAPSTPSPTEGIDSDVSASKDERVEAVSRSSASDATRDAGTKVALGGTHLTAARDEEDRKKDGMVTEHEVGALEKLWVHDSDGRRLLFADVSVYTR